MASDGTIRLIDRLADDLTPVRPLASPARRAAGAITAFAAIALVAIFAMSDLDGTIARHAGREALMAAEMVAILLTGVTGVTAAFFLAIPGRSPAWMLVPLGPLLAWFALGGIGCLAFASQDAAAGGDSMHCLVFILATGIAVGLPLAWLLARAAPIEAGRVTLAAGLGSAGLAAFLLQFFHPFDVTFVDLAIHALAVTLVVVAGALGRRLLGSR